MSQEVSAALVDAAPTVLWLDDPDRPPALDPLTTTTTADLAVVGGGYTGLWTALRAKERHPELDVVLLEAGEWLAGVSRNGGFAAASLTHGYHNGLARWPEELGTLDRLGRRTSTPSRTRCGGIASTATSERTGELDVATAPHQLDSLAEAVDDMRAGGHDVELWDQERTRAAVDSPDVPRRAVDPHGVALVEPARLAWGLRSGVPESGVRIFEQSTVRSLRDDGRELELATAAGRLRARRVALATNGFPPLLRRLRLMTVPVYDYVLATEPLSDAQLASVGWAGRQGVGDSANLFHYYRLTRDNRILWGGYDAVYHYGSRIDPALEQAGRTHALLAQQFLTPSPAGGAGLLAPLGRCHRHRTRFAVRSTGRRQPTASPTRSASRGWASRPPGSPVTCC
ncbi:MAG: FAD-dependent oxidoreductase [Nocardioides sp.]